MGGKPLLNVRYLAVFRAVVKTGSISAAARHLHVSQPAVTKTVRLLEEGIALPLFFRANGRLQLTPEAESLMPEVERLFANVEAIQHLADEIRDGFSGSLSIATVTTLSTSLVANAVGLFFSLGMFGTVFLLSQYLQIVQGYSPLEAGLRTLPWTAASVSATLPPHDCPATTGARSPVQPRTAMSSARSDAAVAVS